jgi:hypothetical protein
MQLIPVAPAFRRQWITRRSTMQRRCSSTTSLCGLRFKLRSIRHLFQCLVFRLTHGEPYEREPDRCGECGNSPQLFFPQLSQVGAGRVNRFAPRGLSQYADDMQQLSFFFPITQPDRYRQLPLISCPALQPIRAARARCARHKTGWGWEGQAR